MDNLDPCLSCTLPDCDEDSPDCKAKQLTRRYNNKLRNGGRDSITEAERAAMCRHFEIWDLERRALAAEHVRPYKRHGSAWTGDTA